MTKTGRDGLVIGLLIINLILLIVLVIGFVIVLVYARGVQSQVESARTQINQIVNTFTTNFDLLKQTLCGFLPNSPICR